MTTVCLSEIRVDLNNVYTCTTCYEQPVFFTEEDYRAHDKRHHVMAIRQNDYQRDQQQSTPRGHTDEKVAIASNENELVLDQLFKDMSFVKDAITMHGKQMGQVFLEIKDLLAEKYSSKNEVKNVNSDTNVSRIPSESSVVASERKKNLQRSLMQAQEESEKLKSTVEDLREDLSATKNQNKNLRDAMSAMKYRNRKLNEDFDLAKSDQMRDDATQEKTRFELQMTKKELNKGHFDNKELKQELSSLKSEFDKTKAGLEESNRLKDHQLKCADDRYSHLFDMEKEQKARMEEINADREKLINSLIVEKSSLKADCQQVKLDYDGLQKQFGSLKEDYSNIEHKLAAAKSEAEKWKRNIISRDIESHEEVNQLKVVIERHKNVIEDMKAQTALIDDFKVKLKDAEDEKNKLASEIKTLKESLNSVTKDIKTKEVAILKLEDDLKKISISKESNEQEKEKFKSLLNSKKEEIKILKDEIDEAEEKHSLVEDKAKNVRKEMFSLKKENGVLNEQVEQMELDLERCREEQLKEDQSLTNRRPTTAAVFSSSDEDDARLPKRGRQKDCKRAQSKEQQKTVASDDEDVVGKHVTTRKKNGFDKPVVTSAHDNLKSSSIARPIKSAKKENTSVKVVKPKKENSILADFDLFPAEPGLPPKKANLVFDDFDEFPTGASTPTRRRRINSEEDSIAPKPASQKPKTRSRMADFDLFPSEPYADKETSIVSEKQSTKRNNPLLSDTENPRKEKGLVNDSKDDMKAFETPKKNSVSDLNNLLLSDSEKSSKNKNTEPSKEMTLDEPAKILKIKEEPFVSNPVLQNKKRKSQKAEPYADKAIDFTLENDNDSSETISPITAPMSKDKLSNNEAGVVSKDTNTNKPQSKCDSFSDLDDFLASDYKTSVTTQKTIPSEPSKGRKKGIGKEPSTSKVANQKSKGSSRMAEFSDIDDLLLSDYESSDKGNQKKTKETKTVPSKPSVLHKTKSSDDFLTLNSELKAAKGKISKNHERSVKASKNFSDTDIDDLLASDTEPSIIKSKKGNEVNDLFPTGKKGTGVRDLFPSGTASGQTNQKSSFMEGLFPSTSKRKKSTGVDDLFPKGDITSKARRSIPKVSEKNEQCVKPIPASKKNGKNTVSGKKQLNEKKDSNHTSLDDESDFDDATIDALLEGL